MRERPLVPVKLDCLRAARRLFEACFADTGLDLEILWVAHVDSRSRCVHLSRYEGDEAGALFPLKAILRDTLEHDSSGILLAHNHPSGDVRPSDSDCRATRRLASAVEALDCAVLDHLIFAEAEWTSFREIGLL